MKIINEQYKNRCLYEGFRTEYPGLFEIISLEYEEDGSVIIRIKSELLRVPRIKFTALKSV